MVKGKQAVFKYKIIKTPLHKLPAIIKLFLLLPLSIFCMSLPSHLLAAGITLAVIAAFLFKFTLSEQVTDLKPALYYAAIMYVLSIISSLFAAGFSSLTILLPHSEFLRIVLRLTLVIQLSAMFFRTTSSIEIRDGLNSIERYIRKLFSCLPVFGKRISPQPKFTENISLFLCFIPEIFNIWANVNLAWKARGGKQGYKKIFTLVFILITLSFEKAALKARALAARGI